MLAPASSAHPPPPPFASHLIAFKHVLWLQTLACINFWRFASECLVSLRYFFLFFCCGSLLSFFYVGGPALATPCTHRWAPSYACKMLNAMSGAENVLKSYSAYRITEFSNGRILKCMSTTYQHDTNPPPLSPHPPPCMCVSLWESEYIYICFAFCCIFLPCKWKGNEELFINLII